MTSGGGIGRASSPRKTYGDLYMNGAAASGSSGQGSVTWASAKAKSKEVNGYPAFSTRQTESGASGFFVRHARRISSGFGLPRFNIGSSGRGSWAEREKLGRGRSYPGGSRWDKVRTFAGSVGRRMRIRLLIALVVLVGFIIFNVTRKCWRSSTSTSKLTKATALKTMYRRAGWLGGGNKYVIVLAANIGGGVMDWKGPREWAIERDSVKNKRKYANKWGYDLEIVDMSTKKRYAHEWRESWEKVDTMRNCMRKYPKAEWYVEIPCSFTEAFRFSVPSKAIATVTLSPSTHVERAVLTFLLHSGFGGSISTLL